MKQYIDYSNHLIAIQNISVLPLDICNIIAKYVINKDEIDTHFMAAVDAGHFLCIKFIHKADANICEWNTFALGKAAEHGHLNVVKYILFHTKCCDIIDAFLSACLNGHLDVVIYLNNANPKCFLENRQAAYYAAVGGNLEVIEYLHKEGADMSYAVDAAYSQNHDSILEYLWNNGIDTYT